MAKRVTLLVAVGLCVAGGFLLLWANFRTVEPQEVVIAVELPRSSPASTIPPQETTQAISQETTPVSSPTAPTNQNTGPADPDGGGDSSMIQITARPSTVRAGPSSSAPMLFGFPAGRQVRVIGHHAGFVKIEDLSKGTQGWIDESALVPSASVDARPGSVRGDTEAAAESNIPSAPAPRMKRDQSGLFGFLQGAFGGR